MIRIYRQVQPPGAFLWEEILARKWSFGGRIANQLGIELPQAVVLLGRIAQQCSGHT